MTNEQETALRVALGNGLIPSSAIDTLIESLRRLSPERMRLVGKIIRGKATWEDWLSHNEDSVGPHAFRDLYLQHPIDGDVYNTIPGVLMKRSLLNTAAPVEMPRPPQTTNQKG